MPAASWYFGRRALVIQEIEALPFDDPASIGPSSGDALQVFDIKSDADIAAFYDAHQSCLLHRHTRSVN
jgi:hypothetical protein